MYEWTEALSVGVRDLDEQHRHLFSLVNEIVVLTSSGSIDDKIALHALLDGIMNYNLYHIKCEENYMHQFDCVDPRHIEGHAWYQEHVGALFDKASAAVRAGTPQCGELCTEMARFTGDWHLKHIEMADRKYTTCFNEHGLT